MFNCKNTISTAEYLQSISVAESTSISNYRKETYAALAPRVSKGFATVTTESIAKNTTIKTVMTINLDFGTVINSKIQIGAINMTVPTPTIRKVMKPSIRLSDINSTEA